jgi:hypothetical protein
LLIEMGVDDDIVKKNMKGTLTARNIKEGAELRIEV